MITPGWLIFVVLGVEVLVVAALSSTRTGARAGVGLALLALPLPAFVAAPPVARALLGIAFFLVAVRALDMARGRQLQGLVRRVLHLVAIVDTRATPAERSVSATDALVAATWLSVLALAVIVVRTPGAYGLSRPLLWLLSAAGLLGALEAAHGLAAIVARTFRGNAPSLSLQPYRSATLSEFWGKRWNPVMSGILREHCFMPLARRPRTALLAAFVASAAVHSYLTLVSLDALMAFTAGLFFVAQMPMMVLERRLGVRRWPRAAGIAWTIGVLLLLWPLLAEPIVRLFVVS